MRLRFFKKENRMQLKDILTNKKTFISYRTFGPNKEDLFTGSCTWTGSELIPDDGDIYSPEDEIVDYRYLPVSDGPDVITVWYESRWI